MVTKVKLIKENKELKNRIKLFNNREEVKLYEKRIKEETEACDSIIYAILNEACIEKPTCPMCFKKFYNLKWYKKHLNEHRKKLKLKEVKNG